MDALLNTTSFSGFLSEISLSFSPGGTSGSGAGPCPAAASIGGCPPPASARVPAALPLGTANPYSQVGSGFHADRCPWAWVRRVGRSCLWGTKFHDPPALSAPPPAPQAAQWSRSTWWGGSLLDFLAVSPPVFRGPSLVPVLSRAALNPSRHLALRPVHGTWHVSCRHALLGPGAVLAYAIATHRRRRRAQPTKLRSRMHHPRVEPWLLQPSVLTDLSTTRWPRHQVSLPGVCKQGVYQ